MAQVDDTPFSTEYFEKIRIEIWTPLSILDLPEYFGTLEALYQPLLIRFNPPALSRGPLLCVTTMIKYSFLLSYRTLLLHTLYFALHVLSNFVIYLLNVLFQIMDFFFSFLCPLFLAAGCHCAMVLFLYYSLEWAAFIIV